MDKDTQTTDVVRVERGYEVQFRTPGNGWTAITHGPEREDRARVRLILDAARDYDARDTEDYGEVEWRLVRVVEEVVEPSRTSQQVVEWLTAERDIPPVLPGKKD